MRQISVSDITIKKYFEKTGRELTFREKLDIAAVLDRVGVNVIEFPKITDMQADSLLIKSLSGSLKNTTLAVNAGIYEQGIDLAHQALRDAAYPRIQIAAPTSSACMEFDYHKKAADMLDCVRRAVRYARTLCDEVEFISSDATRSDGTFLREIISAAIEEGADIISLSDTSGCKLPGEFYTFLTGLISDVPALSGVTLGISCSDELSLADACAVAAIKAGVAEIKTSVLPVGKISLMGLAKVLSAKGEEIGACSSIRITELGHALKEVSEMVENTRRERSPFDDGVRDGGDDTVISPEADFEEVAEAIASLGYELCDEDKVKVWKAAKKIARKKSISRKEFEAIIATESLSVPETYILESYTVTTGNVSDVFAHIKLSRGDEVIDGISLGDGPIDAAFLAVERITGRHFELDDFQLQSITEGREAMGRTLVKLRAHGKVYSGSGTSTDIIGSGIKAYINALNKIVYEEGT